MNSTSGMSVASHSSSTLEVPHPEDYPNRDLVIFDRNCKFCCKQVLKLKAWDTGNRLAFVSLHDSYVADHVSWLTQDQMMKQMYVIDATRGVDGTYGGAAAVKYLSRKLPWLWWIAPVLHIPFSMPLWQWLYLQVAKRRYQLGQNSGDACENGSCSIHLKQ